ncbi:MAG: efflux transporter periplasmic adaptor subunit, partial [Chthoniobacteraceae bacterium]|nr:efflux transporter periplasmic adaptor subunit [Chthoniobacteraceae bacterium]
WIFALLLIIGGTWAYFHRPEAPPEAVGRGGGGGGAGGPPVPVVEGIATARDVPIYLDGLGTVQAFNAVVVRSRVDGQLEKVAFEEGQDIKAGELLVKIDAKPFEATLGQAEAKKKSDEAQLANARLDLTRNVELSARKVIAPQQLDTQKALVSQLEATVKADEATIESARVQVGYATISAPISGRVGIRQVDQGNVIHSSDANGIVSISQLKPISLLFTLPEQNLGAIQEQQAAGGEPLAVVAVGRDNKTELGRGKLAVIDNQIDTTTGTIRLKATFPNEDLKLWPGQFINARLLLTVRKDGIVVPASVVQRGPESSYAFVIKPDQTVELRPVKVAQIAEGQALIEDGLAAGEHVVVDGQYKLQPGSHVVLSSGGKGGGGAAVPGGSEGSGARGGPKEPGRPDKGGGRTPSGAKSPAK